MLYYTLATGGIKMHKQTYVIAFCIFILATGGFTAMPLFVEMTKIHGISLVQVGLMTSVYILAQKLTPLLFGPMGDYFGHKKMACAGEFVRGVGFIGLAFVNPYILLLAFAIIAGLGGGVAGPSLKAFIMLSVDEKYRPTVSALRATASNVAVIVGPALAGVAIFFNYIRGIFIIAGVCYLIGVCLILLFTRTITQPKTNSKPFSVSIYKEIGQNKRFINLLIYMFLAWFLYSQLFITMPEYAKLFTHHIEQVFLINGIMGILLQYPMGFIMSKLNKPSFFLTIGTIMFPLSFFIFGSIHGRIGLYVGIVLFTFGELFMFPMVETMVANFSSDKNMAAYFGVSSLGDGLGRPTGNFLGGLLFGLLSSYSPGWYIFSAVGFGLFLFYFLFLRKTFFTTDKSSINNAYVE